MAEEYSYENEDPGYTGPNNTYQGNYREDPNSPLWGGPGWIDPSQGGGNAPTARLPSSFGGENSYAYPPSQPSGERGSPSSTYATNFPSMSMPGSGIPPSQGTPPQPGRSSNFSGTAATPASLQLNKLISDPNSISENPAYKFFLSRGEQALQRSAGAQKMALSGNSMLDFLKFGQGAASQFWQQIMQQLTNASHLGQFSLGGATGPDPGTQGENAARALIPTYQQLLSRPGSFPGGTPSYGGYSGGR